MAFLNDISLGQYFPSDSFIHRLDPRTKIIVVLLLMSGLLVTFEPLILCGYLVLLILVIKSSKLPLNLVFRNIRPFIWFFLITIAVHLFWTTGDILFTIPAVKLHVTKEGLVIGLLYSVRLALLIIFAAVLTLSTSPIEITDALEKLLVPLKRFKVPTHEIVMMLMLSLRFIPTLLEEAQRLKNAQMSRGATFSGNIFKRIKSIVPLVLPLFISAFRRADELALAMDSRCYGGGQGRTSFKRLEFKTADYLILTLSVVLFFFTIIY